MWHTHVSEKKRTISGPCTLVKEHKQVDLQKVLDAILILWHCQRLCLGTCQITSWGLWLHHQIFLSKLGINKYFISFKQLVFDKVYDTIYEHVNGLISWKKCFYILHIYIYIYIYIFYSDPMVCEQVQNYMKWTNVSQVGY